MDSTAVLHPPVPRRRCCRPGRASSPTGAGDSVSPGGRDAKRHRRSVLLVADDVAEVDRRRVTVDDGITLPLRPGGTAVVRSAERREGEEWVRTCRSRWWPYQ